MSGLILVFDLDQTIVGDWIYPEKYPQNHAGRAAYVRDVRANFNPAILNILKRGAALRGGARGVDAICMLSNNDSAEYVSIVDDYLLELTGSVGRYGDVLPYIRDGLVYSMPGKAYFFDYIMLRRDTSRLVSAKRNTPPALKRILDIEHMVIQLNIPVSNKEDLMRRLYFFDDLDYHIMKKEFEITFDGRYKDHYIHIVPGFDKMNKPSDDKTNYAPIYSALSKLENSKDKSKEKKQDHKKQSLPSEQVKEGFVVVQMTNVEGGIKRIRRNSRTMDRYVGTLLSTST